MKNYFLTGATGFVGRAIVRELLTRPDTFSITLLTRQPQLRWPMLSWSTKLKFYEGDITSVQFPHDSSFTHIIHGANEANDLLQPDAHRYYYTIVEGTERLLDWADTLPTVQEVLVLSSGAAARDTVYGRAKRQCERIAANHLGCKIARIYSLIGEETPLNGQYALGQFIAQALYDWEVRLWGGNAQRTYLHVEDAARWLLAILDLGEVDVPYDVAGDTSVTMEELATKVARLFGVPLKHVAETVAPRGPDLYIPNIAPTLALGCEQTIYLEEALTRLRGHYSQSTREER